MVGVWWVVLDFHSFRSLIIFVAFCEICGASDFWHKSSEKKEFHTKRIKVKTFFLKRKKVSISSLLNGVQELRVYGCDLGR